VRQLIILGGIVIGLLASHTVSAQGRAPSSFELSAGAGWGSLWDDETLLGRGLPVAAGIGWLLGERVRVAADVDWLAHSRDAGYLAADGDLIRVLGRATYLFGAPGSRVRPLAGAGLGVMRSTGKLVMRSVLPGQNGFPTPGPSVESPWESTAGVFELHGGVRIAVNRRAAIRPEFRWGSSIGSSAGTGIEPPFLHMQAIVNVDVSTW
jgi:hypothetical protein